MNKVIWNEMKNMLLALSVGVSLALSYVVYIKF